MSRRRSQDDDSGRYLELDVDGVHGVHEGGVELEAHRGGADVVGGGHESLHGHGTSLRVIGLQKRNPAFSCQLLSSVGRLSS